jgi:hypothetical protein
MPTIYTLRATALLLAQTVIWELSVFGTSLSHFQVLNKLRSSQL